MFLFSHHSIFACNDTQYYLIKYIYMYRLAVCNCLSFTLRSGDLPSPLMAIFTNSLDPEQARQAWSGSKLLDILIMILKDFF